MFHSLDTTAWLSVVSRRKLQQAAASPDRPRDADKLLRKVLLRNSISRVDLALAEAQATSSSSSTSPSILSHSSPSTLPSPQQQQVLPLHSTSGPESPVTLPRPEEDDFVFPDATSLTVSQSYSTEDAEAEARWLESLLEDLSDDEDEDHLSRAHDDSHAGDVTFSHEAEAEEDDEEADFDLDLLWSTNSEPQTLIVIPPLPPPLSPQQNLSLQDLPPFHYPLPDEDDDDLSTTPGMEEDVEDESEADSLEWPNTPGHRSITSLLGRSVSTSSLNQLVASAGRDNTTIMGTTALPSITEGAVYEQSVRPVIHVDEPQLYRYSPAPREQSLATTTTPALDSSSC